MKIIFLGTNGWYTDENGNTACILIDAKDRYVILDAGNGFYKLDKYITEDKPVSLFISHFHLDHVSGLHTLAKFKFKKGLDVYVAEARKKDFETLINPPYTIGFNKRTQNIMNLKMDIRLHQLSEGNHTNPFPFEVIKQLHAYTDHGFRLALENKIIAYSGDCGISNASFKLAKNADVLIHECSYKNAKVKIQKSKIQFKSQKFENGKDTWGHVGPEQAAELAKQSGVKQLIITHFDPTQYKSLSDRKKAEEKAKTIFPNTTVAVDDMVVTI